VPEVTTRLGMMQSRTEQCSEFGIKPRNAGSVAVVAQDARAHLHPAQ
jgi:hypothetical protein